MSTALDSRIAAKLDAFARRRRRLILFRGVCAALAMLGGSMMVVAALDWKFLLPDWLRWTLSGVAYATVLIVAWRACFRLLLQVPDSRRLARFIEGAEPSLREELLSAVELGQGSAAWDSEQFRELVQAEVSTRMEGVQVERLLPAVLLRSAMVALAIVLAVAGAALVLPSLRFGTLLARAFAPGANLDRVSSVQVRIIQPTPAEMAVPQGDSVPLLVELTGRRVTKAYLETFTKSGGRDFIQLQPAPNGRFSAAIQVAREDVEYRIRAFDAITRKYRLQAAPRPRVVKFHKQYRYPAYTGMAAKMVDEESGDIAAVEGTEVEITLDTDQPVKSAALTIEAGQHVTEVRLAPGPGGKLAVTLPLKDSGSYRVELVAAATNFENKFSPEYELRVSPDTIPQVTLETPQRDLIASANEVLALTGTASDDIGLTKVEQHVRINDGRWSSQPLSQEASREVKIDARWDLFQQGVKPGDVVTTKLVATDCKGNRGESRAVAVTIAAAGFERQRLDALAAQRELLKEVGAWRASLETLEKAVSEARKSIERTPDDAAKRKSAVAAADAALEDANTHSAAVQTQLNATLRQAAPGHETANLVLLAREVSRAAASLAYLPNLFQGASLDTPPTFSRELTGEAGEVTSRTVQRGRVGEEQQRNLTGAEELDVLNENLQVIVREQERLATMAQNSGDNAAKWATVSGRMKVVMTEVASTEEQMKFATTGYGNFSDRMGRLLKHFAEPRAAAAKALSGPNQNRELLGPTLNLARLVGETWKSMLDLKRDMAHLPKNAVSTLVQEAGTTWDAFEKMRQEVESALHKERCSDEVRASLAAGRWDARASVWKAFGDAEELRLDADAPFVNDLRNLALALDGARSELITPGEAAAREPAWKRLSELDQAFRVLEPAHELGQLATGFDILANAEHWQAGALRLRTANVTDWNRLELRLRALPGEMDRGNPSDADARTAMKEAGNFLNAAANDPATRNLVEEMQQRGKTDRDPAIMTRDAERLASLVREALEHLRTPIENARRKIAAATPKMPERMAQLAKEAQKLQEATEEKAAKTAEQPPEQSQADARQQMAQQQSLNKKLDALKDAIRSEANMQNVLQDEGREKARDADDALAMLKEPPVRAEQALSEAAAAERAAEQKAALEAASKEDAKLAAALNQLAEHYDAMEKGDAEKSRLALRETEKELGLKEQMDRQYAKAEELAQTAQSSPEEMLAKLEKALPVNPRMRQELSSVSRDLLQSANQQLAKASSQETTISREVEKMAAAAAAAQAAAAQPKPGDPSANPPKDNAAAPKGAEAPNPAAAPSSNAAPANAPPGTNAAPKDSPAPNAPPASPGQANPQPPAAAAAPNPALAKAAEKQAPIAKGAAEAGAALERAGRHEERLQNNPVGEQLQKLGADVQATAMTDVPKAQDALNKAQGAADAQAPVGVAERNLQQELARLGEAQTNAPSGAEKAAAQSPAENGKAMAAAPNAPSAGAPPAQAPAPGDANAAAAAPPTPGSPAAQSPAAPGQSPAPDGKQPGNASATAANPGAPGKPSGAPPDGNAPASPGQPGSPDSSIESFLAGLPAPPQQQVWMARALDALDAAMHDSAANAQQPQQGQAQQPPGQGQQGQPPSPGQPSSDAMQQAQKAMAAAGQAAAAQMRSSRSPTPGKPAAEVENGDEVAASKTGALADAGSKAHGVLPASAGDAAAKGAWGNSRKRWRSSSARGSAKRFRLSTRRKWRLTTG